VRKQNHKVDQHTTFSAYPGPALNLALNSSGRFASPAQTTLGSLSITLRANDIRRTFNQPLALALHTQFVEERMTRLREWRLLESADDR